MKFATFDELFNYRKYCLCGASLETDFFHLTINDDDYICARYSGPVELVNNNSVVKIPCSIESRVSPYGESDFSILANVSSPDFKLDAHFTDPHASLKQTIITAENFVKTHFTKGVQKYLDIRVIRRCSVPSSGFMYANCPYRYDLSIGPLTFDMKKKTIDEINLISEHFSLPMDRSVDPTTVTMYFIESNFRENVTTIKYPTRDPKFVIGARHELKMPADKFQKYPFEPQFLLDKIKMLLLFS